ncbi:MAG: hypothetical protein B7X82_14470 [Hydrogenophilales bacterium 17-64-65]|nr:MAG: hypothetical protein B7X82_14470 [Hydrogenophilales bacterium 17-64-65]HQT32935.1 ATP-binding protein [Thiobacillus sp.]
MYTNSKIWQSTLDPRGDNHDDCRERLRGAYGRFRERVGQLIQTIPSDTIGLTVHDLSHLDALWEMADILSGGNYPLNPAEAFVLGGAILLHDSAMTVAAYPGGVEEVKCTPEYSDAASAISQNYGKSLSAKGTVRDPTAEHLAIAETLRVRHAEKAEELASQAWKSPIDGSSVYLIDDSDLRDHYSRVIGRVAHSHHWDIGRLTRDLGTTLGAFSGFPADWTVDQVKVALILRCIDAMQVDDRRAPHFLAAIRDLGPASMEHWQFQNRLTVPHVEEHRLVYTSKSPFPVEYAGAWNLCFDTIQMVDRELRDANDLHLQKNLPQFLVTGVAGAGSAENFAQYVEVTGWQPLPLNLKVSDVPKLARTLGGHDLYNEPLAPLRELIQNAADAIEVRSLIEDDFSLEDGLITIRFIENGAETILEVEDNGIGMSERVLTTALLDFGFSFWKSSAARREFPGLQAKTDRLRGKYGIGFFSVFMWSSHIAVCSRRFNEGVDATRVLEFRHGLESRPLLRAAGAGEKSSKWSTRMRIALGTDFLTSPIPAPEGRDARLAHMYMSRRNHSEPKSWLQKIRLLCGPLTIKVNVETSSGTQQASLPNWRDCAPNEFLEFFGNVIFNRNAGVDRFIGTLTSFTEPPPLGGRCFISPYSEQNSAIAVYEKGIFITHVTRPGICGVIQSQVTNAARDRFSELTVLNDKTWINAVRPKAFNLCRNLGEQLALQKFLISIDSPDSSQPLFIQNREFLSISELKRKLSEDGFFHIRLVEEREEQFVWKAADRLSVITGLTINERRVHPLVTFDGSVSPDSNLTEQIHSGQEPLFHFLREIQDTLGPNVTITSEHHEVSGYKEDYIDVTFQAEPVD